MNFPGQLNCDHEYVIADDRRIEGRRVTMEIKVCTKCGIAFCASEVDGRILPHVKNAVREGNAVTIIPASTTTGV